MLLCPFPALSSVVIAGTRVIYDARESEAVMKLSNEGKTPALVQAWIDDGNAKAAPAEIAVPFTVTPPVSRIDPGKGQTLRILYTGEPLPPDRESVFWLNVVEIPPKPTGDEAEVNRLQFAFRSRIKLFYRPAGLKGSAGEAPAQIAWRLVNANNRQALEARNPTAYHASFSALEVTAGGKTARFDDGGMVGPGETKVFPLSGELSAGAPGRMRYQAINDYGGPMDAEFDLGTAPAQ
ncbi:fimbria/pilus periplasmic chaperone [Cupriavidus basilensis]|uniref:Fimbria/pilus periplasmic chaperone n=1 Tax=Cupriavidus basilensis TaxID=68895 RepID=A0ABT6B556_9BURK|nr:fimbria/pilus periplasmic chaperone [Cupriavidus basilensis]MDF3840015.1 fimbria/pilus periplasmic chaperone [Cupriavidus basilensis]